MAHFIRLCRLTKAGLEKAGDPQEFFQELRELIDNNGAKLTQAFICLGTYDFVSIIEAPDEETVERIDELVLKQGYYRVRSLRCYPAEEFIEWASAGFGNVFKQWMEDRKRARGLS